MKQSGFSLVEALVYIGLLSLLAIISFSWLSMITKNTHRLQAESNRVMSVQAILQRLTADVHMSDARLGRQRSEPGMVQLAVHGNTICWRQEKDRLYRIENKSKALLATGVTLFAPRIIIEDNQIIGVECAITIGQCAVKQTMKVYNG